MNSKLFHTLISRVSSISQQKFTSFDKIKNEVFNAIRRVMQNLVHMVKETKVIEEVIDKIETTNAKTVKIAECKLSVCV